MNGLLLAAVLRELDTVLPARVERVYQPDPHVLVLRLYAGREVHLLVGADPDLPRLHLTARPPANPPAPPAFCMLLRKHLESLRLVAAQQGPGFDRWLRLDFAAPGPDEPARRRHLAVELLDRRANVVLLDGEGRILDALRRIPGTAATRALLPGSPYEPPPSPTPLPGGDPVAAGRRWLEASAEPEAKANDRGRSRDPRPAWRRLLEQVPVLGRELAQAAFQQAGLDPNTGAPLPVPGPEPLGHPAAARVIPATPAHPGRPAGEDAADPTGTASSSPTGRPASGPTGGSPSAPPGRPSSTMGDAGGDGQGDQGGQRAGTAAPAPGDLPAPHRPSVDPGAALGRIVLSWIGAAQQGRFDPVLVRDGAGAAVALVAFPVTPPPGGRLERDDEGRVWRLCDRFYRERLDVLAQRHLRQQLEQVLREALGRARRRLEAREDDRSRAEQAEPYRVYGELLTAFAGQVPRGARQVELPNYYDPEGAPVVIPLDPALSPQENAQRYFRLYQKAKRGREQAAALLEAAREEVAYLESVEQALAEATTAGDLEAIAGELAEQGYAPAFAHLTARGAPPERSGGGRGGAAPRRGAMGPAARARGAGGDEGAGFLRYRGPGGELILAGRNNRQNDALATRVANPWDVWLHARQVPGSHVLLRLAHREAAPSAEALEAAARVAAYHSKARGSGRVAVDYTEARHVRKPKGARPGFVRYEHARTLFVPPDPEGLPPRLDAVATAGQEGTARDEDAERCGGERRGTGALGDEA